MNEESNESKNVVENATENADASKTSTEALHKAANANDDEGSIKKTDAFKALTETLREIADKIESGEFGGITISLLATFDKEPNTTCVLMGNGKNVVKMFAGAAGSEDGIAEQMAMGVCYAKPEVVKRCLVGAMLFHGRNGR